MSEVKLAFLPKWEDAMVEGRKTATTRAHRHARAGDTFRAFGHRFRVRAVAPIRLRDVGAYWWREEGLLDPLDFRLVWMKLHPRRGFVGDDRVYLHLFRIADPVPLDVRRIA